MKIEQIYTGCLAQAAYYIESNGEAAIIDPLREPQPYISRAEKDGAQIKYVFETHFHADFVSGHHELAGKTGATIVYGPNANCYFEYYEAKDNESFILGDITITALHTPGHTLESTVYLLKDKTGKPYSIFTGDTLFINDVGRPDLAIGSDLTVRDLAGYLYDSLHKKILPLPDDIIVYPAHGAGSACGKKMGKENNDTLGHQKQVNYALQAPDRDTFIKLVTEDLAKAPQYFALNALLNKRGAGNLEIVRKKGLNPLSPSDFESIVTTHKALILDVRSHDVFAKGFIHGAINIGLSGQFAPWVGALVPDLAQAIVLITEPGQEEEAITRLARVGYDNAIGYLHMGLEAWIRAGKPVDSITSISSNEFAAKHYDKDINILDVRNASEFSSGHIGLAANRPLGDINDWITEINPAKTYYVHCAAGYRSMIASSILKANGVNNVIDLAGGYKALSTSSLPTIEDTKAAV